MLCVIQMLRQDVLRVRKSVYVCRISMGHGHCKYFENITNLLTKPILHHAAAKIKRFLKKICNKFVNNYAVFFYAAHIAANKDIKCS